MEPSAVIPANETPEQRDIRLNKDVAAFSYVWIISVVVFFARKDSPFIQYHSKQAIILFLLTIPAAFIPLLGKFLVFVLMAGMLLGFINAAQGLRSDIPIVGPLATGEMKLDDIWKNAQPFLKRLMTILSHIFKKPDAQGAKTESAPSPPPSPAETPPPSPPQPPSAPPPSLDNSVPKL